MNTQVINARENRSQMIMKIQNKLDELGFERFYLSPYNYNVNHTSEVDFSCTKRETLERHIIMNLADRDYFEYTDWWEDFITDIPKEVFVGSDRYPYESNRHWVHWEEYNPLVNSDSHTELTEISYGSIKGWTQEGHSGAELYFRVPFKDDSRISPQLCHYWTNFDDILEFIWEMVNNPKMIKFNELANKPNEYFEKDTNK